MKKQNLILPVIFSLGLLLMSCSAIGSDSKKTSDAAKPTPAVAEKRSYDDKAAFPIHAEGVQIYQCIDGTSEWKLKEPKAVLYDDNGKPVGHHFRDAGGPAWQSEADGNPTSKVVADTAKRSVAADPLGENIDMLWLGVKSTEGTGVFGKIKSIQRVNTVGGKAPAGACETDKEVSVNYTATYYFYVAKP